MIYKVAKLIPLFSFVFGTILYVLFFAIKWQYVFYAGFWYVIVAVIVNLDLLVALIFKMFTDKANRKKALISMCFIVVNIPIVIIYGYFVVDSVMSELF